MEGGKLKPIVQERSEAPISGEFMERKGLLRKLLAKEAELTARVPGFVPPVIPLDVLGGSGSLGSSSLLGADAPTRELSGDVGDDPVGGTGGVREGGGVKMNTYMDLKSSNGEVTVGEKGETVSGRGGRKGEEGGVEMDER